MSVNSPTPIGKLFILLAAKKYKNYGLSYLFLFFSIGYQNNA